MFQQKVKEAAQYITSQGVTDAKVGLILGSGLGELAEEVEKPIRIPYEKIPHFPISTVQGHKSEIVFGRLEGVNVLIYRGRFHFYEGYSMHEVTFPVRVLHELGIRNLIVTNAAGGLNESFSPGNLMIIKDHINLMGQNPLIGPNVDHWGVRFPDLSNAYKEELRKIAKDAATNLKIKLHEGVYAAMTGPSYETPAEIKMIQYLGADAVGMSTVPEVIVANHANMNILGISCISNMAAGISEVALSHEEVIETTENVKHDFKQLMKAIVKML